MFSHCAESQCCLRAEKEMLGNLLQKDWRSAEWFQLPLSALTRVALWAEGRSGWRCWKYREQLISPSALAEAGRIRADCSSCFLHLSVHCVLRVCTAAEGSLILHQGCDGNVQAGEPDPFPFLPTPPRSWAHPAQWMGFLLTEQSYRGFLIFFISWLLVMKQMQCLRGLLEPTDC